MLDLLGRLFGAPKALEGIVDGASRALDTLVYTDQERAADHAAQVTEARRMVIEWMASTQGQNLARRLIALSVTAVWLVSYLAAMAMDMLNVWIADDRLSRSAELARTAAGDMVPAVMLILGFYFAAPQMGQMATAAIAAFGERFTPKDGRTRDG